MAGNISCERDGHTALMEAVIELAKEDLEIFYGKVRKWHIKGGPSLIITQDDIYAAEFFEGLEKLPPRIIEMRDECLTHCKRIRGVQNAV